MPHSTKSTRDKEGRRTCGYCGRPIVNPAAVTCRAHADLPALEPLDDRYTLREDAPRV